MRDEHSSMAMNAISHAALMCQVSIQQVVAGYGEPSVVYKPRIFKDGDSWCCLLGENIQEGVCGFGDTPSLATQDFNNLWYGLGQYAAPKEK